MSAHKKIECLVVSVLYAALASMAFDFGRVAVAQFPSALAGTVESAKVDPTLSCHLRGRIMRETRDEKSRTVDLEQTPDGLFVAGNLTSLLLNVRLDGGDWRVDLMEQMYSELRPPPPWKVLKRTTVKVTIDSLTEGKDDIPFAVGSSGGGGSYKTHTHHLHIAMQIDEPERRENAEKYYQRLINSMEPSDPIFKQYVDKKEGIMDLLTKMGAIQNKPGVYRISCSYNSEKGPWTGTLQAETLILKIVYEKSIFELEHFDPESDANRSKREAN